MSSRGDGRASDRAERTARRSGWGRFVKRALRVAEYLLWGGVVRERLLVRLLKGHYESRVRREWYYAPEPPHFFDLRISWFLSGFGSHPRGPYSFFPGLHVSEILRVGDKVLDIGCGDGFFTERFYASRAAHVDAIDIEPSAILHAESFHAAPNISYILGDAVETPFPSDDYDVVAWNGAIGHFSRTDSDVVLSKIARALSKGGIFVGSESLGEEGSDHLQYFMNLEQLRNVVGKGFEHVRMAKQEYRGVVGEWTRTEAYWVCCNDPARLKLLDWRSSDTRSKGAGSPERADD